MPDADNQPNDSLTTKFAEWCALWGCPELPAQVTVRIDNRLRTSVARASASKLEIRLHPDLETAPVDLVNAVLCHELAHLACATQFGNKHKPHGPEWKRLVGLAGYDAETHLRVHDQAPASDPKAAHPGSQSQERLLYDHTCPVCHFSRTARRAMRNWRCPECTAAGLEGELHVYSVPTGTS